MFSKFYLILGALCHINGATRTPGGSNLVVGGDHCPRSASYVAVVSVRRCLARVCNSGMNNYSITNRRECRTLIPVIYWFLYEILKQELTSFNKRSRPNLWDSFIAGAIAGSVSLTGIMMFIYYCCCSCCCCCCCCYYYY